jgi:RNA polymerase sigma factor (sigma-70 family)
MSSTPSPRTGSGPDQTDHLAIQFADQLGPCSKVHVQRPTVRDEVRRRVASGADVEDAVLACMHAALSDDRRIADEFAAFFMVELKRTGPRPMPARSQLRRVFETADLINSVFKDVWIQVADLEFRTRYEFLSLLRRRVNWKAADKARSSLPKGPVEDGRTAMAEDAELAPDEVPEQSPPEQVIRNEESQRLILLLLQMDDRDRKLLSMRLRGESIKDIAGALDLSYEAARKALTRAKLQARKLAAASPPSL